MGTRGRLVAGNWKMFRTLSESVALARDLAGKLSEIRGVEVAVCPGFAALESVGRALAGSEIGLGAQNCFWEAEGAFTGEVSPAQLRDAGCRYVILGHSERRQQLGETSEQVHRKLGAALAEGLTPVVCVGETLAEREAGDTFEVVDEQTERSLGGRDGGSLGPLVLAYEPVWAIGTGKNASPSQAQDVHSHLRQLMRRLLGAGFADGLRILYGGSVKESNASELFGESDVDGALVGGASLSASEFAAIVKLAA